MNIKLMRLVTGEDIITEIVDEGPLGTKINNPLIVYIRPTEVGVPTVGMSQWIPYSSDKEFYIKADKIVVVSEPAADLRSQYDRVFGAGLIMPNQMLTS